MAYIYEVIIQQSAEFDAVLFRRFFDDGIKAHRTGFRELDAIRLRDPEWSHAIRLLVHRHEVH